MQRKLYKELWAIRFQKMLKLEEQSAIAYESVLEECKDQWKENPELETSLKKIISDEKKHAKLVRELLEIVNQQED